MEDEKIVKKVIEENREGLERLAREEDAEAKRNNKLKRRLKEVYLRLKHLGRDRENEFTVIEA